MRNRVLHDALRDFALEAAVALSAELDAGAELEFEIDEGPAGRAVLYRYRPLTAQFIAARWSQLRTLSTREAAERALGAGAEPYLRTRGAAGDDPEPALRAMLERLWEDASSFSFPEERFERVYTEVEATLYRDITRVEMLTSLAGVRIAEERVELGGGLSLRRGEGADAPVEALWPRALEAPGGAPSTLCVLDCDLGGQSVFPLDEARGRFSTLLRALRLWGPGAVGLGAVAWARASGGSWRAFPLQPSGPGRGDPLLVRAGEGEELAGLLDALVHGRPGGATAWALDRFDMGCERCNEVEALSDYLLALDALLDGGADRAPLALRMAALCAEERDRRSLQRRLELAFSLERFVAGGGNGQAYLEQIGSEGPHSLVGNVEEHLRALLRDVLCGYLDADLRSAADDVLLESAEPLDIRAHDLRAPGAVPGDDLSEQGVTPSEEWAGDPGAAYSAPI